MYQFSSILPRHAPCSVHFLSLSRVLSPHGPMCPPIRHMHCSARLPFALHLSLYSLGLAVLPVLVSLARCMSRRGRDPQLALQSIHRLKLFVVVLSRNQSKISLPVDCHRLLLRLVSLTRFDSYRASSNILIIYDSTRRDSNQVEHKYSILTDSYT